MLQMKFNFIKNTFSRTNTNFNLNSLKSMRSEKQKMCVLSRPQVTYPSSIVNRFECATPQTAYIATHTLCVSHIYVHSNTRDLLSTDGTWLKKPQSYTHSTFKWAQSDGFATAAPSPADAGNMDKKGYILYIYIICSIEYI